MENILCLSLQVHNSVTAVSEVSQHAAIYLPLGPFSVATVTGDI